MKLHLKEIVHNAIYKVADLDSQIPDVDQIAEFLYTELKLNSPNISLELFTVQFLEHLGQESLLSSAFFDQVIEFFTNLNSQIQTPFIITSWTQGNVFLQTQKAEIFQSQLKADNLAKPSIYASTQKLSILNNLATDLQKQNCDLICLIDDRLNNIIRATEILKEQSIPIIYIHKIRPDKKIINRLEEKQKNINLREVIEWSELISILNEFPCHKIGFILDKDGIIYNSTNYRKALESSLIDFCQNYLQLQN